MSDKLDIKRKTIKIKFLDGENIIVKMMFIKNPDGRITVSSELNGYLLDQGAISDFKKGVKPNGSGKNN